MRILILSCGTGGGHNDAARGVAQALEARGHEAVLLDHYLAMAGKLVDRAVCDSYIETVRYCPAAFRGLYDVGRGASNLLHAAGVRSPVYAANAAQAKGLRALLTQRHFDAVVTTHLFAAETLTWLRRSGMELPMTVAVATDYTCLPFWEETDCDWYVVPNAATAADFARHGVPTARLQLLGIPAPAAFTTHFDRAAARAALGFAPDKKYLLVMGGSMGAGDLRGLIGRIRAGMSPEMRLVALTGSNAALHAALAKAYAGDRAVWLPQEPCAAVPYLQACDVLFTKPGGLTSVESALCRIPTVLLSPLSPCEDANRDALVRAGCALAPVSTASRAKWGLRLARDARTAAAMRRAQAAFLPENPAQALADFLEERIGPA
jgi:processive 1,2-diacylglycerol beta-glucosyltransferase